jgi:hypothetical protein
LLETRSHRAHSSSKSPVLPTAISHNCHDRNDSNFTLSVSRSNEITLSVLNQLISIISHTLRTFLSQLGTTQSSCNSSSETLIFYWKNSVASVRKLVSEVSANFCGWRGDESLRPYSRLSRLEPLLFLPSSSSVIVTMLSGPRSRPTTFFLVVPGNRTRDLGICSQEF